MSAISDVFKAKPERPGVQKTPELGRILALPRRKLDLTRGTVDGLPLIDLNPLYLHNGGRCERYPKCPLCAAGEVKLWPAQSAVLMEAEMGWGLLGPLQVGGGKTLCTLLLPDVFASKRTVLLVPAMLKNQLVTRDFGNYGRHFLLPLDRITVVAYSELSVASGADILDRVGPDLIIADECHALSQPKSSRTMRFLRYMAAHPETKFCGLSGTVTRRSIRDYAHLCEIALRHNSPVPRKWTDLQDWADALDPVRDPMPIGALKVFVEPAKLAACKDSEELRMAAREGFQARLVETPGIVATSDSWAGSSLIISAIRPEVPESVIDYIKTVNKTWEISGEEIEDPMRMKEISRQLSSGFFYKWIWPLGIPDEEWLEARAAWHKACREVLQRSRPGLDSPLLVSRAADRNELYATACKDAWNVWKTVKDRYKPTPPVEPVWISDFVIDAAVAWADKKLGYKQPPAILWYSHEAVGEAIAARGFPLYGAGTDAGEADPERKKIIVCSIRAQGTGKNLQRYAHNLVVEPPASGATWEQLIGRTHRPGQLADEVWFEVFTHTPVLDESLGRAVDYAYYVHQTQGQRQKILIAQRLNW